MEVGTDCPGTVLDVLLFLGFKVKRICGWYDTPDEYEECREGEAEIGYEDRLRDKVDEAIMNLLSVYDGVTVELENFCFSAEVDFYSSPKVAVESGLFCSPSLGAVSIRRGCA